MYIENRNHKRLFTRVTGEGTAVLLIHGVMVDSDFYQDAAAYLSRYYKVITYDRRGYSRSEKEDSYSLRAQAEDAKDILDFLGIAKAVVIGASAGGMIAMKLADLYPEMVMKCIVHEPPVVCFGDTITKDEKDWMVKINQCIEAGKYRKGVMTFLAGSGGQQNVHARPVSTEKIDQHIQNGLIFISGEFREQLTEDSSIFDIEHLRSSGLIIPTVGDSSGDTYAVRGTRKLAEQLHKELVYVPGGHNAPYDLPYEFAIMMRGIIEMEKSNESG